MQNCLVLCSLSLTHTHTHSYTHTLSLAHTHILSHTRSHTLSHSLSLCPTHTLSLSLTFCYSLSLTHTQTHRPSRRQSRILQQEDSSSSVPQCPHLAGMSKAALVKVRSFYSLFYFILIFYITFTIVRHSTAQRICLTVLTSESEFKLLFIFLLFSSLR